MYNQVKIDIWVLYMKEKIYFIPGLMTDERLWKRVIPFLENEYEIVHIPIPRSEDFDEIIDILFNDSTFAPKTKQFSSHIS